MHGLRSPAARFPTRPTNACMIVHVTGGNWSHTHRQATVMASLPAATVQPVCSLGSTIRGSRRLGRRSAVRVRAIDAAQPFDFESRAKARLASEAKLRIGIVGFGTFGQFLAKRMIERGHTVLATSRTPYDDVARKLGVEFYADPNDFCEEHPEVVLLASSILSCETVFKSLPVQRLRRNTLFVDVLSVKVFPKQLLLRELPPEIDILCTHPMFGPDSGKGAWTGLNFMFEKVRVGADARRQKRVDSLLKFFREEGCSMVEMSCEEHDRQAASTQFITHTVGRVLGAMQLGPTEINTKGYEALLNLVNNTTNDSFDLYYGLFLYNQNATEELERLEGALDHVKKQLFGRLHDIARRQLFPDTPLQSSSSGDSSSNGGSQSKGAAVRPRPSFSQPPDDGGVRDGNGSSSQKVLDVLGGISSASVIAVGEQAEAARNGAGKAAVQQTVDRPKR